MLWWHLQFNHFSMTLCLIVIFSGLSTQYVYHVFYVTHYGTCSTTTLDGINTIVIFSFTTGKTIADTTLYYEHVQWRRYKTSSWGCYLFIIIVVLMIIGQVILSSFLLQYDSDFRLPSAYRPTFAPSHNI